MISPPPVKSHNTGQRRKPVLMYKCISPLLFFVLEIDDPLHFVFGTAVRIISAGQIFFQQAFSQLDTDHLGPHGHDIGMVGKLGSLCLINVVDAGSISALYLVGGDGDTDTGST